MKLGKLSSKLALNSLSWLIDELKIVFAQRRERLPIQTLIMSKDRFKTAQAAKNWAKEHNFKFGKVDETENSFRLRQFNPDQCKRGSFRTFRIAEGIQAVGCNKK